MGGGKTMFDNWDDNQLLNQIWDYCEHNQAQMGCYSLRHCLNEAVRRGIGDQLYHSEQTAQELLNDKRH